MKQESFIILAFFLISFQISTCQSPESKVNINLPQNDITPGDWLDSVFSLIEPNTKTAHTDTENPNNKGNEPIKQTSQGMSSVVRPDGTSTTTTYFTDENGVTTTETHNN